MGFEQEEKAYAKKTKEIYDRAEARFSDELGAAIEEAKARKQNPPSKKDEG